MHDPVDETKKCLPNTNTEDREIVTRIVEGNSLLAALFLKQKCAKIFEYIKDTRLEDLDLQVDDLVSDFFIYLQENNWEKLRTFRFESRLQTWINVVASRYLSKKYASELKERSKTGAQLDSIPSFTDEGHHYSTVRFIVGVDAGELFPHSGIEGLYEIMEDWLERRPDHALVITDINRFHGVNEEFRVLNFENGLPVKHTFPSDRFMDAWDDSDYFMVMAKKKV